MTEPLPLPESCTLTLEAVLRDPLAPGASAERHLKTCPTCSEARVAFLAQEEVPLALAPAGYFDRLPDRVLAKLPARPRRAHTRPLYWGMAAALLLAVGATSFWVGRANRTPLVEASLPRPAAELQEILPEKPYEDGEDAITQLSALSQEEAEAVFRNLDHGRRPSPSKK